MRIILYILQLRDPIRFNERQNKVELPTVEPRFNEKAILTGWGRMENGRYPRKLRQVELTVLPARYCELIIEEPVQEGIICAITEKGRGSCYVSIIYIFYFYKIKVLYIILLFAYIFE